uniref:Uncharacterized protein n=1 Tax=Rhizophora mucronata TaxID=61149 RepID=A0A2P2KVT0_RHIMU
MHNRNSKRLGRDDILNNLYAVPRLTEPLVLFLPESGILSTTASAFDSSAFSSGGGGGGLKDFSSAASLVASTGSTFGASTVSGGGSDENSDSTFVGSFTIAL